MVKKIFLISALGLFIAACASKIPRSEIPASADVSTEMALIEKSLEADRRQHIDILAPDEFEKSYTWLKEAREDWADKKDRAQVIESLSYAKGYQLKARELSSERSESVRAILEARTSAMAAGADSYAQTKLQLQSLDKDMAKASVDFNKKLSATDQAELQKKYIEVQAFAVLNRELSDSYDRVKVVVDEGGERKIPDTLKKAQVAVVDAENLIKANVSSPDKYRSQVREARARTTFMINVWDQYNRNNGRIPESVAVQLAEKNKSIATLRSELEEAQVDRQLQESRMRAQAPLVNRQYTIEQVRSQYSQDEAEVLQSGDSVIIRLKSLSFKKGQATLPDPAKDLVARTNRLITELNPNKVIVEGHTDSTGSAVVNEKLSQSRAQAVADYMKLNGLQNENITAVGYGFNKPISSDKVSSKQNRRVDIILEM